MPKLRFVILEKAIQNEDIGGDNDLVVVVVPEKNKTFFIELDNCDGYRSFTVIHENPPIDIIDLIGSIDKFREIEYDKIEFHVEKTKQVEHGYVYTETNTWDIIAYKDGKVVFIIGTLNSDDYYPSYTVWWKEKEEDKFEL